MPTDDQDDIDWLYHRDEPAPRAGGTSRRGSAQPQAAPQRPLSLRRGPRSTDPGGRPGAGRPAGPPPHRPAPPPSSRTRRRRGPGRLLVVALLVFVLGGLAWLVSIPISAWSKISKVADEPGIERPADQPGTTFLLVGNDARGGLTPEEAAELAVDSETSGDRTDSMMLLHVPPSGRPALISLPRDSFVSIPGHGKGKLNSAYTFGGPALLIGTVEQVTGLRIDGYMEVGFGGFGRVVKALDGVQMCLDKDFPDEQQHEAIPAGCRRLTPRQALWYVRARHFAATQDLDRVQRQRTFIGAVMKETMSPATLLNPMKLSAVADAGARGLAVGEHTQLWDTVRVGLAMGKFSSNGISLTVPIADADAATSAGSSVLWDKPRCLELFGQLQRGDTSNLERFKD